MHGSTRVTLACIVGLCVALAVAGCGPAPRQPAVRSPVTPGSGPVYPANAMTDPIVAKTVAGDASPVNLENRASGASTSPAVSAEIRGYLVDWVIPYGGGGRGIVELAVLKDGSAYRLGASHMRPSAAFGHVATPRETPESPAEKVARLAALAKAQAFVAKRFPPFAKVTPSVFNYLVRIHRADGSSTDVWVDPVVGKGRFFYGLGLKKVEPAAR